MASNAVSAPEFGNKYWTIAHGVRLHCRARPLLPHGAYLAALSQLH